MNLFHIQVALGKEAKYEYIPHDEELPPAGYNSLRANAREIPRPDYNAAMPTGITFDFVNTQNSTQ